MTSDFLIRELKKNDIAAEISTQVLDGEKISGVTIGGTSSRLFYRESFLKDMPRNQVQSLIEAIKLLLPEELRVNTADTRFREPEPDIYSWDYAKDNMYLYPFTRSESPVNVCKKNYLDLNLYVCVDASPLATDSVSSYVVTATQLKNWGISEDELFEVAKENSKNDLIINDSLEEFKLREAELRKMGVLKSEIDTLRKHEEKNREITVTCKSGHSAAIVVFDNVLEEVANTLQNRYTQDYMFSFTDENTVVVKPVNEYLDLSELADFARKIHSSDTLPSHPYFYGAEKRLLFENLHEYIKYLEGLGMSQDEIEDEYNIDIEDDEEEYEE